MKKIVVLDLDGTLLRKDKTVSQYTVDTLLKFKEENNDILFATARPPRDAYKYVPQLLRDNPIICYNGACILNGKEISFKKEITREDALEIIKNVKNLGYNQISIEVNDTLYSNFDTSDFFGNAPNQIVDLENMNFEKAYKVMVCSKTPISKEVIDELPKSCKGIITDNGTLCQIVDKEASKWNSVKSLTDKIGINTENIIAFGDDYNDFDIIRNAGVGVAMKNAEQDIKDIANSVTEFNNNDDGVAKYIEEKILNS